MALLSRHRKERQHLSAPSRPKRAAKRQGRGSMRYMKNPVFLRGPSDEVAGLYPFSVGSGAPQIGVPIGRLKGEGRARGAVLCCDPKSWFERARLISNPSAFILGLPGLGKSTLIRRWILGMDWQGVRSLVLGDLKGEHVDLILAMGGQEIVVGRGRGYINALDMGEAPAAVARLNAEADRLTWEKGGDLARAKKLREAGKSLLAEARARRQQAGETLLTIHRGTPLTSRETPIVSAALRVLDERITDRQLLIGDLLAVVQEGPDELHVAALSRGDKLKYQETVEALESDLTSLAAGDGLGEIFSQQTTIKMSPDRSVVFNVKPIDANDPKLRAAALMICWGIGFSQISVHNTLADMGLEPQRPVQVIMDELWQALRAGEGLVDLADGLTRLNRDKGVSIVYASHTMEDLNAIPSAADRAKAMGMVERCGMVALFGLPASEMPRLANAVSLTIAEQQTLQGWTTPPTLSAKSSKRQAPPGQGLVMFKVGKWKGLTAKVDLQPGELQFSNTDQRWDVAA